MNAPLRHPEENAEAVAEMIREFGQRILDPWWRITSGALYKIITKDEHVLLGEEDEDEDQPDVVRPFIPNEPQMRFLRALHHRNLILKARQLGFTTLISIAWLDHALFNANQICAMIAQNRKTAGRIFRNKVCFAYDRMPEMCRVAFPTRLRSAEELVFDHNGSQIIVSTSFRGDTAHRMHVSELGAIARDAPIKSKEIVEGSLPAVPQTGIGVVESTAEGAAGDFYDLSTRAEKLWQQRKPLAPLDYRFHFFPWFDNPKYRTDPKLVTVSAKEHQYFDRIEMTMKVKLDTWQRAWYVSIRDGQLRGSQESMWKQFPSEPKECWQVSTEGVFFAEQLALARVQGRITHIPFVSNVPVNTFWDIGSNDGTGIWVHQRVGSQHRLLRYIEGWFKGFATFIAQLDGLSEEIGMPIVWGRHFLPHDAEAYRQGEHAPISPLTVLNGIKPGWRWEIVPRVRDFGHGIKLTREAFGDFWFDEEGSKDGLAHLGSYRQAFNTRVGGWTGEPVKDRHTEAADAIRQLAQGWSEDGGVVAGARPNRKGAARGMP